MSLCGKQSVRSRVALPLNVTVVAIPVGLLADTLDQKVDEGSNLGG